MLHIERRSSPPITIQDTRVSVHSQVVKLWFPIVNGGLIWNRPVAIRIRTADGRERIAPIADVTRTVTFILVGLCFTAMFVVMVLRRR
jgi:hypothetical protein